MQHKHPMQYQRTAPDERKKNDDAKRSSILNFVSTQSNKPVSDRVCENLKGAIAQWIASSARPTAKYCGRSWIKNGAACSSPESKLHLTKSSYYHCTDV